MKAWKLSPLAVALISVNSYAVEPTGLALGSGITFLPAFNLDVESNSNIYSVADDETSDTVTRLKPAFAMQGDFGKAQLNATYQAEQGTYGADDNDDYLDQKLNAGFGYEITSRQQLNIDASYNGGHDAKGSASLEGQTGNVDPSEYDETTGGLTYVYGADSATANITAFADSYQKRYQNNDAATANLNYSKVNYGAILSLTSSPDAEVIFEARQTDITYVEDTAAGSEGYEQRLFTGMRWDISGATTGEVKVGRSSRFFTEDSKSSNTRLAWEANLTWQPLTYSTVVISSAQSSNETNSTGDYVANTFTSASWDHEFSTYISAGINASVNSDVYVADADDRKDDLVSFGISTTYSPMPWMDVKLSYNQAKRDSTADEFEYENQIVNLGLNLAL